MLVSCPARVDIGNRLDYPNYFLSFAGQTAKTANVAIQLRTTITYFPNRQHKISFVSNSTVEDHFGCPDPEKSRFPILCAVLHHFGITSGTFQVESEVPPATGLGGSGMLIVAALALVKKLRYGSVSKRDWPKLALTAHLFEIWLGFSSTGFQDQLAAAYGGANLWTWGAQLDGQGFAIYTRSSIVPTGGTAELERHIVLCFTGKPHRRNRPTPGFRRLSGTELSQWETISSYTDKFSTAVRSSDWTTAAHYLNAECELREAIDSECLSSRARVLVKCGRNCGAGCRFAGHGHGGCVWAIGDASAITTAIEHWKSITRNWKGAWVVRPKLAVEGLVLQE